MVRCIAPSSPPGPSLTLGVTACVAVTVGAMASDDYFLEIEGHFASRRGTPFILSGKDWALMQRWREEGIPLPIVIEAIDSVFEKNETSGRRKVISSLSYCRHAVKELWDERREIYAGAGEVMPEVNPEARLESLAQQIAVISPE